MASREIVFEIILPKIEELNLVGQVQPTRDGGEGQWCVDVRIAHTDETISLDYYEAVEMHPATFVWWSNGEEFLAHNDKEIMKIFRRLGRQAFERTMEDFH